ncbi:MAG TPA: ABC transporter permease [Thermoanaerobaculales bacterium]|nr:ABC transporter permease [Thermoanaerobaculales bacterium]HQL30430.1 ABC transporter permease [Thermoanaerobaculales bacterium]HQN95095.1 ABC transporter permease [Thermoanaerobaculales bacterium]
MTGLGSFLRQLLRDIRSQTLRTFLTTFGIIWGTVAVALLLAFGEGLHRQQIKSFAGLGDHIVIAWPARTSLPYQGLGKGRAIRLDEADIDSVRATVENIDAISTEYSRNLRLRLGDQGRGVEVSGVSPVFGELRSMVPAEGGRFIDPIDMEQRRRVAFIGDQLATELFGDADPVGREVLVHGSPFTIVGVMVAKEQDSSYSGRDHSKLIIPSTTFRALTGQRYIDNLIYRATDPKLNKQVSTQIIAVLGERKKFDPTDSEAVSIWDTTEMFVFFDNFMLAFKIFLGIMGGLTLVVGGIGVSNIMNVVVEERTREIGIKMALGARGGSILAQFVLETMVLTAVGGAIGLAISWAICAAVPAAGVTRFVGVPVLSPQIAALTAGVLGLVGLVAGYFPAREASRLDPVIAMKL